jgi:methylated-DNA-[protein]-cysteine S-methyltransferase
MAYSYQVIVGSPLGDLLVQGSKTHIQFLKFNDVISDVVGDEKADWFDVCIRQLQQYFSGERHVFDLPIDPQGTEFQNRVWHALCDIDLGQVASYQQIAIAIGNVNSVRAVASANARNPIWLNIPCHRIIGSDLALRGYAGGIVRKAQLLMREGLAIECENPSLVTEKTKLVPHK